MVPLTFKTITGQQMILDLEPGMKISEVKELLQRRLKFESGTIRLLYSGRILPESSTVGDIVFRPNTFIIIHFTRAAPGSAPPPPPSQNQSAPSQNQSAPAQSQRAPPQLPVKSPHEELQQFILSDPGNLERVLHLIGRARPVLGRQIMADPAPFLRQIGFRVNRSADGRIGVELPQAQQRVPAQVGPSESEFSAEELQQIRGLVDLGVNFETAAQAWRACGGNTDLAAQVLLGLD
jgi:hypothetical protein